ncbi:MAG: electron transfer flavoprotein subunit beta/FixA family protein [Thermoplasmata archaeon]
MSDLNLIVPMKEVPDIENVEFDKERGRIDRSSAEAEPNPFDLNALEEAVRIKEEIGGTITVLSMGPPQSEETLREALSRGADEAILLTDKNFAGSDTWATSYTLAMAIRKIGDYDLILCGEKSVDGDTGQVGPEIAEILDIPHVAFVNEVKDWGENSISVRSETWNRSYIRKVEFPGLITVTKDVNEPRLPSLSDKLSAKKAEIEKWGISDLEDFAKEGNYGGTGSPTAVVNIEVPEEKGRKGQMFKGEPKEAVEKLLSSLEKDVGGM